MWGVWLIGISVASSPTHPVCGGIPGGMYDDVARVGGALSVTMHRKISEDADAIFLAAVFYDGRGHVVGRWKGEHARSFWSKPTDTWVHRASLPIPDGAAQVRLTDRHHGRTCVIELDEGVRITEVRRTGQVRDGRTVSDLPEEVDETLVGDAVEVKRGRKARLAARKLEEPPDNLEERARLLAKLKQNLPRMRRQQVLDWMGHQGFAPDDPDVIETLGEGWLDSVRE